MDFAYALMLCASEVRLSRAAFFVSASKTSFMPWRTCLLMSRIAATTWRRMPGPSLISDSAHFLYGLTYCAGMEYPPNMGELTPPMFAIGFGIGLGIGFGVPPPPPVFCVVSCSALSPLRICSSIWRIVSRICAW